MGVPGVEERAERAARHPNALQARKGALPLVEIVHAPELGPPFPDASASELEAIIKLVYSMDVIFVNL